MSGNNNSSNRSFIFTEKKTNYQNYIYKMEKATLSLKKMDCFFNHGKDGCLLSISFLKNPVGFPNVSL